MQLHRQFSDIPIQNLPSIKFENPLPEQPTFVIVIIAAVPIISLICFFYIMYRRYRTREDYDQSPQNFSKKPQLSVFEQYNLKYKHFISLTQPDGQEIVRQHTKLGEHEEITFKAPECCVYYHNLQTRNCYFEIEVIQLNSIISIGFVHQKQIKEICKKNDDEYNLDYERYGVFVNSDGLISIYANKKYDFNWQLDYGDVIGIGVTETNGEVRGWISKNGKLLNPPSQWETIKNIDVGKEEVVEKGDFEKELNKEQKKEQIEEMKELDANFEKKKLNLRSTQSFKYYPVIISERGDEQTIIHVNIGGEIFRMFEKDLMSGVLI